MRPADAEALLESKSADYLTVNERIVFLFLLRRGDNLDCRIPPTVTPRLALVSRRCGISSRTLRRCLTHLDRHGWLKYQAARGKRKGQIDVAPRMPDLRCGCPKPARAVATSNGQSCGQFEVASTGDVAAGQTESSAGDPLGGKEREEECDPWNAPPPPGPSTSPEISHGEDPALLVPDHVPALHLVGAEPANDESLANVVPIQRQRYPSQWCDRARALWAAGYDA